MRDKLAKKADPNARIFLLVNEALKNAEEARKYVEGHRPLPGDETMARIRKQYECTRLLREIDCLLAVCASEKRAARFTSAERKEVIESLATVLRTVQLLDRAPEISTNEDLDSLAESSIRSSKNILASL